MASWFSLPVTDHIIHLHNSNGNTYHFNLGRILHEHQFGQLNIIPAGFMTPSIDGMWSYTIPKVDEVKKELETAKGELETAKEEIEKLKAELAAAKEETAAANEEAAAAKEEAAAAKEELAVEKSKSILSKLKSLF